MQFGELHKPLFLRKCKTRKCLFHPHKRRCPTHYICQTTRKSHEIRILMAYIFQNDEPSTSMYFFTYFFYHTEYQKVRSWRILHSSRQCETITKYPPHLRNMGLQRPFSCRFTTHEFNSVRFQNVHKTSQNNRLKCEQPNRDGVDIYWYEMTSKPLKLCFERNFLSRIKGHTFRWSAQTLVPRETKTRKCIFQQQKRRYLTNYIRQTTRKSHGFGFLWHISSKMTSHQLQCTSSHISSSTRKTKKLDLETSITPHVNA